MNIIFAFQILNTVMLAGAAALWSHLGHVMKWRAASIWVGFVALFAGFANARHALYYPALTDSTAFALGMAIAWAYLARKPIVLWLCAAAALVTWPALGVIALVMLVLPRLDVTLPAPAERWLWWLHGGSALLAPAATAAFLLLARHYLAHPVQALGIPKFATWVRRDLLPVTVVTLAGTLAAGWYTIVHQPAVWNVPAFVRSIRWRHVALAGAGPVSPRRTSPCPARRC